MCYRLAMPHDGEATLLVLDTVEHIGESSGGLGCRDVRHENQIIGFSRVMEPLDMIDPARGNDHAQGRHLSRGTAQSGVYSRCMQRTNIFLTEEQQRRLDRRAKEEGLSKSGLIRMILDDALAITRATTTPEQAIEATSGLWVDRDVAELGKVLRWRREAPLQRLNR